VSEEQVHIQGRFNQTDNQEILRVYTTLREDLSQAQIIELGLIAMGPVVLEDFSPPPNPYLDYLKRIGGKNNGE